MQVSEANGLSDNNVQCILKDKEGRLWIGTADGLNLLDGSVIRKFFQQPGSNLPSNNIKALAEDAAGNTWIGAGNAVCCFDKNKQTFLPYLLPKSEFENPVSVNSILPVNNQIWIGSSGGLYLLDVATKKITAVINHAGDAKNNYRFCNSINKVFADSDKNLWLCTYDGLWKLDANRVFKKINGQPGTFYHPLCMDVYESSDKKLWIGNWQYGLQQVNKANDSITGYHQLPGAVGNVKSICEMPLANGKYLLLLNGSLNAFDPFENKFLQLPLPASLKQYPGIKTIYRSADGWLWFGTENEGLFIANPGSQYFHHFFPGDNISSQPVLVSEWNNSLLIGGEGNHLLKAYDSNWQVLKDFYTGILPNPANINFATMLCLAKESSTSWWAGTTAGLVHFNPAGREKKWYTAKVKDSSRLPSNFITAVFIDSEKQIWVFPWRQGAWKMDRATGRFYRVWNGFIKEAGLEKKLVVAGAAEDTAGNIWMADLDEGIVLFEKETGQFSKPFADGLGEKYNTSKIYFLNRWLYSFTGNVLLKWKDKSAVQKIELPRGMNKELFDIAPDKNNNWWLAGKSGLVYYNERQNSFKRFTSGDGLVSNNMDGVLYCKSDSNMVFASSTYFTSFSPSALLQEDNAAPAVLLTGVSVNDSSIGLNSRSLDLGYRQNNLLFQWALPGFTNPFANNYYCRLKGIDTAWRFVGNRGEIQYASLAPGAYTILLKATTANGTPAPGIITYNFVIHPPLWKQTWFIITLALLAAFIVFGLVRKRITAIRKKAAMQKEMVELEMKALRAQMNPHFIFNSLNSIQECIVTSNTDAAYNYLSQFSRLVRRILENSGKATVPITEELEMMKWYLNLEQLRFSDELTISIQNKFSNPEFEIPSMVIQPFIENALWHGLAQKQGEKNLKIVVFESQHLVNIAIEDNGIGRKAASQLPKREGKTSMGIQIATERLQHFSYASSVETIDLLDEAGNAAGTKVIIHLPNY